ncbi:MAG: molecular chaperone HtpG [Bacteroidales bacterium]|nr:molecular chaperone HtpG [Bacteroidales bacterium]
MTTGKINVTTENIFPVIKQFLYSDQEIFLRELISNAVDATQKLKTLSSVGEFEGEIGDTTIEVKIDKDKKTLTISDKGIGMNKSEIDRYINQIAFSSAENFVKKYKDKASVIGHFGLGFYSAFMVAEKVEIVSQSYKKAKTVHWECDGSPEYQLDETDKKDRGTDIILHISDDANEYLEEYRIKELLNKYCRFLPIPIAFGKKTEWKDGKEVELDEFNIINDTNPAWTRKPADLKDEDYEKFYHALYPMSEEPLFHIHLNVDYPFNLTGILYFPKIKNNIEIQKNKIQLYSNQVFVTDSVEGIVPEFLTLLHGVLDSPDIPLNVSRSYLQADGNVKKIASHITKKVADRLNDIFKNERSQFEEKWNDLSIFVTYGMLTDEKFYERAEKFALFKNVDGKHFTYEEYKTLISENQTDKDGQLVYLYSSNAIDQHSFIEAAKAKGYDILLFDGQLDTHLVNQLEQKFDKVKFVRVDADVADKLIAKDDSYSSSFNLEQEALITPVFKAHTPKKGDFQVSFEGLSKDEMPVIITQNEFMRRMKDMSAMGGGGMNFYGELPDSYNLVVNTNNALIKSILEDTENNTKSELKPIEDELNSLKSDIENLEKLKEGKKDEEVPQEEKEKLNDLQKQQSDLESKKDELLKSFGANQKIAKQVIDLALLANNMLKGEDLTKFVKRSVELIEK